MLVSAGVWVDSSPSMNKRRFLVISAGLAIAGLPQPSPAQARSGEPRRVGVLAPSTAAREEVTLKPFFDQMRQLGWIEGETVAYDRVFANDQQQDLPKLAAELVARRPELIYAPPTPAAVAAKGATDALPIVFGAVWDPVGSGLVKTLPEPGGNVTGICVFAESLAPKRLQLLREVLPDLKRIGWLGDLTDPTTKFERQTAEPAAAAFGIGISVADAGNPASIDTAVERLIADRVDAIYTGTSPLIYNHRTRLIELANRHRLPVVAYRSQLAEAGALFTYGTSLPDQIRRSALFVDKILRGAKPAALPVEQSTMFELVVNLQTAKTLGISIPRSFLLRADRIIE